MSRVIAKPIALLDGSTQPARIVEPGSDAERYFDEGRVMDKIAAFLGDLAVLSDPRAPA